MSRFVQKTKYTRYISSKYNTDSKILKIKPSKYIIVLAWNMYKDIINKIKKYNKIKYVIIPLPKFKIIKL